MSKPVFIALGYCSNDHLCQVPEIPVDGKVEISDLQVQGGGPAAGAAVGAARLGLAAAMVSAVGDDSEGQRIIRDFNADGVDTSAIRVRTNAQSPVAYCWSTPDGRRSIAWTQNHIPLLTAGEIPEDMIRQARILHLDGHHPEAALAAARVAKAAGVTVSLDAGTFTPHIDDLLALADILIASEAFAKRWSGETETPDALRKLRAHNPTAFAVGCTMGAEGSLMLLPDGGILSCPAFRNLRIVDTTGAGDAYHAAFAAESLFNRNLKHLMRFATAFAGLKCGKLGARAGLPHREQVEELLREQPV